MIKQYQLENLEERLVKSYYDHSTKEEVIHLGLQILEEAYKQIKRQHILANHIAKNNGYPINKYKVESFTKQFAKWDNLDLKQTTYLYTTADKKDTIKIFEHNWFAGSGIPVQGIGWVGLIEVE